MMNRRQFLLIFIAFAAVFVQSCVSSQGRISSKTRPSGFVYVKDMIPDIEIDMKYAGSDNFIGRPIEGYERPVAILSGQAAAALEEIQDEIRPYGLSLKIFDAYRPQRAVDQFYRWAGDPADQKNKLKYYPGVDKRFLFKEGYISDKSSHSRGSTVDLTIVYRSKNNSSKELDMGGGFDLFSVKSWPDSPDVTVQQRANRLLLRELMLRHGFVPYPKEWWHFTFENEPWPDTYFDFSVK